MLVCVAPLVALAGWGWIEHRAGYVHKHEAALRQALGMRVRIGQVIHPRPGVSRYLDLELVDVETDETIITCRTVELREANAPGRPAELALQGVTIKAGAIAPLYGLAEQLLRGDYRSEDLYVSLSTDAIEFEKSISFPELKGISGTIRSTQREAVARIEFFPVEAEAPAAGADNSGSADAAAAKLAVSTGEDASSDEKKTLLRLVRIRQQGRAIEGFEIHTGSVALPCETLAPLAGTDLSALAGSFFQGSVWSSQDTPGGWLELRGDLIDVDLHRLVGNRFGHVLEGTVDVTIHSSRCDNGRLTEADLTIGGGPGRVSRSMLSAAADALRFRPPFRPEPAQEMFPFKQLAASVQINKKGQCLITGRCLGAPGAVLMPPDGVPLWTEPQQLDQPRPVSALLRALVAFDGPTAPANAEIAWLLGK
ncbi:MAG TPA: hypothetical protein VGJ26_21665, partial [Pirellulales bacterium]